MSRKVGNLSEISCLLCHKCHTSFSSCDLEISRKEDVISVPDLGLQGWGKMCQWHRHAWFARKVSKKQKITLGKHVFLIIFALASLEVLCVFGARFLGQLVLCPGPWNDISMFCKNAIAGLQEGTRGSVFLFENGSSDALKGWTVFSMDIWWKFQFMQSCNKQETGCDLGARFESPRMRKNVSMT